MVPLLTHGAAEAESSDVDANWIPWHQHDRECDRGRLRRHRRPAPDRSEHSGQRHDRDHRQRLASRRRDLQRDNFAVYLDGNLEASIAPGFHPRSDSAQPVALGAMLKKADGLPTAGRFQGVLDEARVWNVARTEGQIQGSMNSELTSGTGLVARWGLNEAPGTSVTDSIATAANGTITGTGSAWVAGFVPPAAGNTRAGRADAEQPGERGDRCRHLADARCGRLRPRRRPADRHLLRPPVRERRLRPDRPAHEGVASGTDTTISWPDIGAGQTFQWYATVKRRHHDHRTGPTWTFHTTPSADPVFVGAGDIADCGRTQDEATGAVIGAVDGNVWTAGDNVYPTGSVASNSRTATKQPGVATIKARTRPIPGNHDWGTDQGGAENLVALQRLLRCERDRRERQELLQLRHRGQQLACRQPRH